MPRDKRIWMTFPIDFWQHPKIAPLSDAAFRAFVEMNGYSRMQDLDGRISVALVNRMWAAEAIDELLSNHPDRPSLAIVDGEYVIWNYDEHQQTKAEREATAAKNAANGAKGGRPRKNPPETQSLSSGLASGKPNETEAEANEKQSQSQSQSQRTDTTYVPKSGHVGNRAKTRTDLSAEVLTEAKHAGVGDLGAALDLFEPIVGEMNPRHGIELARTILRRSPTPVLRPTAYIATACRRPDEIRNICVDTLDIPIAAVTPQHTKDIA